MAKRKFHRKKIYHKKFDQKSRDYRSKEYKEWRKEVRKRDGHKCRFPKCRARKNLKVHHIKKWADHPNLRFVVGNGITLCNRHHQMIWNKEEQYVGLFLSILRMRKEKE